MPLNTTLEEQRDEGARQLAEKIRLEKAVIRDFRRLFKQMGKDLEAFYSVTGLVSDAELYRDDIKAILLPHYRRVADSFGGVISDFLRSAPADEPVIQALSVIAEESDTDISSIISQIETRVILESREFISSRVDSQVQLITQTNQVQLNRSITETIANISQQGGSADAPEVAAEARSEFVRISTPRAETIASTTTQEAAEGIKSIEHTALTETLVAAGYIELSKKAWATLGDSLVRIFHNEANGQTQPVDQPFVVGGQLLMFPGDRSLGASAGNTINCRCSSLLVITSNNIRNSFNSGLRG